MSNQSTEQRREWVNFGALGAILVGVVVGVALLRPLIFDRIVPSVLGLNGVRVVEPPATTPLPPTAVPDVTDEVAPPAEPTPVPGEAGEPAGDPTALPTIRYVIQPGDNLTRIARQHNVSVELLVELNALQNPDRLTPGTVLIIPQP